MDRGAWQASIHGITRVGHDLATKPSPPEGRGTVCPLVLSRLTEGSGQALGACMWNSQSETQRKTDTKDLLLYDCSLTFDPPVGEPGVSLTNYGIFTI